MPGFFIFILFLLMVAGFIVISSLYVVKQQSVAIIERFGLLASIKLQHEFNCASCRARS